MFSIADVISDEDIESEQSENDEDDSNFVHPIRASLSITKVCLVYLDFVSFADNALVNWFWGTKY